MQHMWKDLGQKKSEYFNHLQIKIRYSLLRISSLQLLYI